jgi:hypothetical protein
MKTKIIDEFIKATDTLLGEKFDKKEAALILVMTDKRSIQGIKGGGNAVMYLLIQEMASDDNFYRALREALNLFEENKEQIIKDLSNKE